LYVVQSGSLMEPFTAAYKGSTSIRGARGVLGFFVTSVCTLRLGNWFVEVVGVVDMFISFGRIVPAIMAVCAQHVGGWVVWARRVDGRWARV
jgi:hypothetical protein